MVIPRGSTAFIQGFIPESRLKCWKVKIQHGTIYSATSFLGKCRKVVRDIWFEKSGSRNLVQEIWFKKSGQRKVVDQKKGGFIPCIQIFSGSRKVVDQKKKSEFEEPLFYTFLEKRLQNKWSITSFDGSGIF